MWHPGGMERRRQARPGTPKASEDTERSGVPQRALDVPNPAETKLAEAGPWAGLDD